MLGYNHLNNIIIIDDDIFIMSGGVECSYTSMMKGFTCTDSTNLGGENRVDFIAHLVKFSFIRHKKD